MIYFAADIHLGAGSREASRATERRFVAWLDAAARDAGTIFLLGDVFDFWFEYHRVVPKGFVRTLGKLAELSDRGIKIHIFTGNHDMWVYDYLHTECGVEIHTAPEVVTLYGRRIFLAHGDNMNIKGQPMLRLMNAVFRSRTARWLFSWLVHPDLALKFGHWWSGHSRKKHNAEAECGADEVARQAGCYTAPLVEYARNYARSSGVDTFIFGHMHFSREYRDAEIHTLHLGCWEAGTSYATMDASGTLTLKTLEQ